MGRRWDKAFSPSVANPTPNYPYPNAHDLQIIVDHPAKTVYFGPSLKLKDPQGKFDRADLTAWPTAFPRTVNGWKGFTRLAFTFPASGSKRFQIDYLDVNGNLLGTSNLPFVILP